MKGMKGLFDLGGKSVLRLGLLVFSTLLIVGGSIFFYDRLVYERALSVGGVITGSTTQTGLNPVPGTILILAVSAVLISLSVFGFLREVFRGKRSKELVKSSSPTDSVSLPLEIGPPLQVPSVQRDWEESPKKEESKH